MPFPEYPGPEQRPAEDPQGRPESGWGQPADEQPQRPPPYRGQYGEAPPVGGWQPPQAPQHPGQQAYWGQGHYAQWPYNQQATPQAPDPRRMRRPGHVTAGCVLAWVGAGLGILFGLLFLVLHNSALLLDPLTDQMRQAGMSIDRSETASLLQTVGIIMTLWCLAVAVVAGFAFRRARWAAITLLVMAGCSVAIGLVNLLAGNPAGLIQSAWSLVSALLVIRGGQAWYAAAHRR